MCPLFLAFACPFQQLIVEFNLVTLHPGGVVELPVIVKLFHLLLAQDSISGQVRVSSQVSRALVFDGLQESLELLKNVRCPRRGFVAFCLSGYDVAKLPKQELLPDLLQQILQRSHGVVVGAQNRID